MLVKVLFNILGIPGMRLGRVDMVSSIEQVYNQVGVYIPEGMYSYTSVAQINYVTISLYNCIPR